MPRRLIQLLGAALLLCADNAQSQTVPDGGRRINVMPSAGGNPIVDFYSGSPRARARSRANAAVLFVPPLIGTTRRGPFVGANFQSNGLGTSSTAMISNQTVTPYNGILSRGTPQTVPYNGIVSRSTPQAVPFTGFVPQSSLQVTPFVGGISRGVTQFAPISPIITQPQVVPYNGIFSQNVIPGNPYSKPGNIIGVPALRAVPFRSTTSFGRTSFGRIGGFSGRRR